MAATQSVRGGRKRGTDITPKRILELSTLSRGKVVVG